MLDVTIRNEVINEVIKSELNANEQVILELISFNSKITKPQMKDKTGFSMSTIERTIRTLKEKGILERVGSNKSGYWKIITH